MIAAAVIAVLALVGLVTLCVVTPDDVQDWGRGDRW